MQVETNTQVRIMRMMKNQNPLITYFDDTYCMLCVLVVLLCGLKVCHFVKKCKKMTRLHTHYASEPSLLLKSREWLQ